jgi:protein-S-isoprenylcysteine O-methyltransferase Ste14
MPLALRALIFVVLLPGTVAIGVPALLLSTGAEIHSFDIGWLRLLGAGPLTLGATLLFWCVADFAFVGRGTLAPVDAPTTLVMTGPYRLVRNPMYVAVVLIILSEALLFESLTLVVYGLALWSISHLFVVSFEEPALSRSFGAQYASYRSSVSRWLPRRPR